MSIEYDYGSSKLNYFVQALRDGLFRNKEWVISVFAVTKDDKEVAPYPYQLVKGDKKYFYRSPEDLNVLMEIGETDIKVPLLKHSDPIRISYTAAANLPPVKQMFETTYGVLFANYCLLIYPFGNKLPYIFNTNDFMKLEEVIATKLTDDKINDGKEHLDKIFVSEYIKFTNAAFYLNGFTQLWVPAASYKSMTSHPDLAKYKAQLIEENKDKLHDPAVIADIEAKLIKFDQDNWLKGDSSEGFLISKKSKEIVRKKLFLMYGAEPGLEDKIEVNPITNSLSEGWDIEKFPEMANALRAGSFNRGAQTVLGGESVKWLLRASSNMVIAGEDCGTKLGFPLEVSEENKKGLIGRFIVQEKGSALVTEENISKIIGKKVMVRSPMFCQLEKTDYCKCCVGERLSIHEQGLSAAVSDYGNAFLYIFMSAAHSKGLVTAKLDIEKSFT